MLYASLSILTGVCTSLKDSLSVTSDGKTCAFEVGFYFDGHEFTFSQLNSLLFINLFKISVVVN